MLLCSSCHTKAHHRDKAMTTSRLTADAMRRKADRDEYIGGHAPYGWRVAPNGCDLEPHVGEQAAAAFAKGQRAAGLSLRKVGAALASRGILPRTGKGWHPEKVKRLCAAKAASSP